MKAYPSIEYYGDHWGIQGIAFDKIDGSNLRFEYSHKRGFYKFGTRGVTIDESSEPFGFAIPLFREKYEEGLSRIFSTREMRNIQSFVCFAELHGESSAFGKHDFSAPFDITLIDVSLYKKGIMLPREFIRTFGELGIPRVVYEGPLNRELVRSVKENEYSLEEGVIFKSTSAVKGNTGYLCKIKTNEWFERLRSHDSVMYGKEIKETRE